MATQAGKPPPPPPRKYAAPTLEPPKLSPSQRITPANATAPGRCTRSGAEYSPWADAVALRVPNVRLTQLLHRRDAGPDSDTESLDDSDSDDEDTPPAAPNPPATVEWFIMHNQSNCTPTPAVLKPPAAPALAASGPLTFIQVAPPGHPPGTRLPNGLMPGSVIRVMRVAPPQEKATATQVKARRLAKKHAKDRGARFLDREQQCVNAGTRLKGVTHLRVRQTVPALQLGLSINEYASPVAASGWQAIRQDEPDARDHDLDEIRTPIPVIDADHNVLLLLAGFPPNEAAWGPDIADNAAEAMEQAAEEIYTGPKWRRKAGLYDPVPRRGSHHPKHVGAAMGGGQRYP
ncbi:hypothetical protein B0H16DRAFT_1748471 [Mycena metata]|uniref:Uncharacterized protein n=1 Tax=Mycena metata TaxID=1033252 RepID=A0AAD7DWU4_9AGAR|nr:hypothetical protein B0H16DRAFT_1748471 [Mycena metata]